MIAGLFFALGGILGPGEVVARLHAEPPEVQVGEPCRLVLEVERPEGAKVRLPDVDPIPDDAWVLIEPRKLERSEPTRLVASWKAMSLEAGDRNLAALQVDVETKDGTRKVDVSSDPVHVLPALAEGEDAPRPMRGFRDAPPAGGARGRLVLGAFAAALAIAAVLYVLRRRRRKVAPVPAPSSIDRLDGLRRRVADDPDAARAIVYELSALLRGSVDASLGEDRASLVDADWSARVETDERVPLGVRRTAAKILHDSERIKYALHAPTRFALEEMLADARNALEALAAANAQPKEKAA